MESKQWEARKVVIVGAGAVGSTFAYALAQNGIADEIALLDVNKKLTEGQVLDLAHGKPFFPSVRIYSGDQSDYSNAQVIVITAGAKQNPGESRLDLIRRNAIIIENIVDDIVKQNSHAVIIIVSNPVDVLTYIAHHRSGLPRGRVIGSGTVLDSARFRYLLSNSCDIDIHNIHAYILGEHGDSEFAAWSLTNIAGMHLTEYCPICKKCDDWNKRQYEIEIQVRNSAYHIIDYKGATYYAVGLALVRIVEAIVRNQRSVLTVSTLIDGEYGLKDLCLSVPCIVTQDGVEQIIETELSPEENNKLKDSARVLHKVIKNLKQVQ